MCYDIAGGRPLQTWVYRGVPAFDERLGTKDAVTAGCVDYAAMAAHDTTALVLRVALRDLLLP